MSNVQLMRELYEALGRGDRPAVLGAMDPGIEWREAEGNPYEPSGKAWLGPDAILQNLFIRLATEWDGFTVHPGEFHDTGDVVVVEARRGRPTLGGRPLLYATGWTRASFPRALQHPIRSRYGCRARSPTA